MTFEQAVKTLELKLPDSNVPVSAQFLLDTLKEDVVLAAQRPGSWEGANMLHVLQAHGFLNEF